MEDERRKKHFEDHCRVRFMEEVNPKELIPHLTCLTESLREEVRCWQNNEGPRHAAFLFAMELVKKDNWYEDVLQALRKIKNNSLADAIEGKQAGSSDDRINPGPDDGHDDGRPGNGGIHEGGNTQLPFNPHRLKEGVNRKNGDSSTDAANISDCTVTSSKGRSVPPGAISKVHTRQNKPAPPTLNTTFRKLPARVNKILEKLKTSNSWKELSYEIEPGMTTEEFSQLENAPDPTRVLCTRLQAREDVTLQVLLEHLYDIERIDIITDLQEQLNISDWNTPDDEEEPNNSLSAATGAESSNHGNNPTESNIKAKEANIIQDKPHGSPFTGHYEDKSAADSQECEQKVADASQTAKVKPNEACNPIIVRDQIETGNTEPEASICTSSLDKDGPSLVAHNVNDSSNEKVYYKNQPNLENSPNVLGSVIDNSDSSIGSVVKIEESSIVKNEEGNSSNGNFVKSVEAKTDEVGEYSRKETRNNPSPMNQQVSGLRTGYLNDNPLQLSSAIDDAPSSLVSDIILDNNHAAVAKESVEENAPDQQPKPGVSNVNSTWMNEESKNSSGSSVASSAANLSKAAPSGQSPAAASVTVKGNPVDGQEENSRQDTGEYLWKLARQNPQETQEKLAAIQGKNIQCNNGLDTQLLTDEMGGHTTPGDDSKQVPPKLEAGELLISGDSAISNNNGGNQDKENRESDSSKTVMQNEGQGWFNIPYVIQCVSELSSNIGNTQVYN